jgi:hypothetical protein
MSSSRWISLIGRVSLLCGAIVFAVGSARAQTLPSSNSSGFNAVSAGESSSSAFPPATNDDLGGATGLPSAASAEGARGAGGQSGGYQSHSLFSHLTAAFGGGFNGPARGSSSYITWGGNASLGAGYRFNRYLAMMTEYQFIDDKLPGALIAETGANGGNAHIWSLTMAPVIDLAPKRTNGLYVTGGGGFYRKVTSFTDPVLVEYCDIFYCQVGTTNQVVGHFSSNQGGWNVGGGFTHKMGGMQSEGRMKLFAEVRYLFIDTPAVTSSPNGLGITTVAAGTRLIPVTLGLRW